MQIIQMTHQALISLWTMGAMVFASYGSVAADKWPLERDRGWQEAVISVRNAEAWQKTLSELGGWEVVRRGTADQRLLAYWSLPRTASATEILMQNTGESRGLVRLIAISGVEQIQIRSNAQPWDTGGIFSLLVRSRDVTANFKEAQRLQFSGYNDPVDIDFNGVLLRNIILRGPDGVNFGVYERVNPKLEGYPNLKKLSQPFNAMQIVKDVDVAKAFYKEALGYAAVFDGTYTSAGPSANNFGLPANYANKIPMKVAIMGAAGTSQGHVELVQWDGFEGRDLAARAMPPNLGVMALRFPVANLNQRHDALQAKGIAIALPIKTMTLEPYGEVEMFAIRSPDGVLLELFAPKDR